MDLKVFWVSLLFAFTMGEKVYAQNQNQTHSNYVAECKSALGLSSNEQIPGFNCFDGIFLADEKGFVVNGYLGGQYVGKVEFENRPYIDAVYLCRGVSSYATEDPYANFALAGYIIHNRNNGQTCFFDGNPSRPISELQAPIDGGTQSSIAWLKPSEMDGAPCVGCHTADPYIVTPGMAQPFRELQLMGERDLKGDYFIAGEGNPNSFFEDAQTRRQNSFEPNPDPQCLACHYIGRNLDINLSVQPLMPNQGSSIDPLYTLQSNKFFHNSGDYFRITNAYRVDTDLHIESTNLAAGPSQPYWWSAQWRLEEIKSGSYYYYRIRNRWTPSGHHEYLNVQNGVVQTSSLSGITPKSAQWIIMEGYEDFSDPGNYYLKNRETGDYLMVFFGALVMVPQNNVSGAGFSTYYNTQWNFELLN